VISLVGQDRRGQVGWPARLPLPTGNSSNAASPRRREHTIEEVVILSRWVNRTQIGRKAQSRPISPPTACCCRQVTPGDFSPH